MPPRRPRASPNTSFSKPRQTNGSKSNVSTPAALPPPTPAGRAMSPKSTYDHNLRSVRRRDPTIVTIFDKFDHVCVYLLQNGKWEKAGYEGAAFLFERYASLLECSCRAADVPHFHEGRVSLVMGCTSSTGQAPMTISSTSTPKTTWRWPLPLCCPIESTQTIPPSAYPTRNGPLRSKRRRRRALGWMGSHLTSTRRRPRLATLGRWAFGSCRTRTARICCMRHWCGMS